MPVERFRRSCVALLSVTLLSLGVQAPAAAGIVGTADALAAAGQQDALALVRSSLARNDVRERMVALGVDPAEVDGRIAALTGSELTMLADRLEQAPAGGDSVLAIIGIVFIVLVILEYTGTIDIFKKA